MHDIIDTNDDIFIKMDIEGGEIPWINSLTDKQINKFEQIVMEFHSPFSDKEIDVFNKINLTHITDLFFFIRPIYFVIITHSFSPL